MIDAPHEDAEYRLVGAEQLHLLVLDAKVLLLDHDAAAKKHFVLGLLCGING